MDGLRWGESQKVRSGALADRLRRGSGEVRPSMMCAATVPSRVRVGRSVPLRARGRARHSAIIAATREVPTVALEVTHSIFPSWSATTRRNGAEPLLRITWRAPVRDHPSQDIGHARPVRGPSTATVMHDHSLTVAPVKRPELHTIRTRPTRRRERGPRCR
jgi:hypothetical protein